MSTFAVHERFEEWATRTPVATAVVHGDQRLTYRELNQRAGDLACHLRDVGIGPGQLVGVSAGRDLDVIVAIIGIFKAGGAYLPLDPDYPSERLDFMIGDSQVDTIVAPSSMASKLAHAKVRLVFTDQQPETDAGRPSTHAVGRARLDDLAYVMYTSGSTGVPKGVMVSHRNVARLFDATRHWYGFDPSDVWTLFHSCSFDFSVWEMWGALAHGGSLVIVPHEVSRIPQRFRRLVRDQGVTVLNQTPSAFYQFMQADLVSRQPGDLALRYVILGGEALDFPGLLPWFERRGDKKPRLINMYGITETTVHVTYRPVTEHDARREPVSLIGIPIPDLQLHVLGTDVKPVSTGDVGELYVGGAGVSLGYLNRPELTEERFVPDPFDPGSSRPLYRTGDLVRMRSDGELEYHGRADDQVQLRGFRVELGDVQANLAAHPAVADAVVAVEPESTPTPRMVAYVVLRSEVATERDLRDWMKARLPEHMVPSALVFLDRLPLTANGKVDRTALPQRTRARSALGEPYVAPRAGLERYLARTWEEILQLDRVGVHDRFFELGGTSLQAAQFITRLEQKLGEPIFHITIFSAPSVAGYSRLLIENYPEAVAEHFDLQGDSAARQHRGAAESERVTPELLDRMRRFIPAVKCNDRGAAQPRLNPAVFILAPPRSGTTLLRVMLAGHPQLFAASELLLLGFDTLGARRQAYSGRFSLWREGLLRALMDIHSCGPDDAEQIMRSAESEGLTTTELYRRIQQWIAPRILVDKSPAYALDPIALRKAEQDFREPLYIHLVRHPYAMVESFVRNRIDQVLYLEPHPFDSRRVAEMVWTISNQTILDFLGEVPAHRQHRLRFEDLATGPEHSMRALCSQLGLTFDQQLLRPYDDLESKMVDGLHPGSTPMGDRMFMLHGEIRSDIADRWRRELEDDFLGDVTWALTEQLGYRRTQTPTRAARSADGSRRQLLVNQGQKRRAARRLPWRHDGRPADRPEPKGAE